MEVPPSSVSPDELGERRSLARPPRLLGRPEGKPCVFLAHPGSHAQVEVSHPRPSEARALVSSGAIRPVR